MIPSMTAIDHVYVEVEHQRQLGSRKPMGLESRENSGFGVMTVGD